ncbi:MAG: energy-coupled thiamine transporter ThiT [Clostridiales bacterium]|jgi:thiamine transporter|nr:energy-coupled thiamine transporter ThiT [Eubacteriales bacterium]MDH7567141.1 energy-coupled thiamine transporter ThiT [Clostridiales bacterium]
MFEGFSIIIRESVATLFQPKSLLTLLALLALVAGMLTISKKTVYNTRTLTYGALSIATAFLLSFLRILQLPNGGSITVAGMLPLLIFAYIAGPRAGMAAGMCYGLIDFFYDPYFVHWAQFILDYPLAYASLGVAGYFRRNIYIGSVVGGMLRLLCHFVSGVIFFASYAQGQNVYLYSLLYNLSYMVPDIVICLIIVFIPGVHAAIERVKEASLQMNYGN